ncbi:hypothetical protein LBMAG53_08000 [Planctomycetota bacterium]|nr:hypothetical protein LBMAG53_08000 [Planctomycetota bacterium]
MSSGSRLWDWIAQRNPPRTGARREPPATTRTSPRTPGHNHRKPSAAKLSAESVAAFLVAQGLHVAVRVHRNRTIALGLRGRTGAWRLGIHAALLEDPALIEALPAWITAGGGGRHPVIIQALARLDARLIASLPPVEAEPLGRPWDLAKEFSRIHATWFGDLPPPEVGWSRDSHRSRQRHIRFGSYHRGPPARVLLHPRLNQPWVAKVFVEHVLYHELCHHRQACQPVRREKPHSQRFKQWEGTYPHYALAIAWERSHRHRLMRSETVSE